jgi:hypothetical protein
MKDLNKVVEICGAIGGIAFGVAVFGLGFPDDPGGGLAVGGAGSVLMLIGGLGGFALRFLARRRDRDGAPDLTGRR